MFFLLTVLFLEAIYTHSVHNLGSSEFTLFCDTGRMVKCNIVVAEEFEMSIHLLQ